MLYYQIAYVFGLNKILTKRQPLSGMLVIPMIFLPKEIDKVTFYKDFPQARGKTVVLLVGGLLPNKGAFDLLEVIANLSAEEREKLLFVLPGKGERSRAKPLSLKRTFRNSF